MWTKLRKDEYVMNDDVFRMNKEKEQKIKELDYRHFNFGRFA